ncbi:unnamed protein product [Ascophyllum nodosum]
MATPSTWPIITGRVVWRVETTQTTTVEVVDDATGERRFYSKVTATVTTGQEILIDTTWTIVQAPPPNMGIQYDRTSTMGGTNQASSEEQETTKPKKYSSKSRGFLWLCG